MTEYAKKGAGRPSRVFCGKGEGEERREATLSSESSSTIVDSSVGGITGWSCPAGMTSLTLARQTLEPVAGHTHTNTNDAVSSSSLL